jgi:ABC-type sugar transport system permease subunit
MIESQGSAVTVRGVNRLRNGRYREIWPAVFLLPAIFMLGVVFVFPLISVVKFSFYAGRVGDLAPVGFANYYNLLHDSVFLIAIKNNLKLLITAPVSVALALTISLILYEGVKGWRSYRIIVFIPYIIPGTVVGLSFSYLLQQSGILNTVLNRLHLSKLALDWLGNGTLSIYSVGGLLIWSQLGFSVIALTAALLSLPQEVNEAAIVDGASKWQKQRYVIIPQLKNTIQFLFVLQIINALAWVFPYVFTLTRGGPGNSSMVMDLFIWQYGFSLGSVGYASAAAVYLLGLSGIFIYLYSRIRRNQEEL